MLDVLIQTFNEEQNLPHALASVAGWTGRVFVVDSGSTDRTLEIARASGATVVEHAWEGYARQKNWALDNLPFESPWVMILDADEAITPQLRREIEQLCARPADSVPQSGFYINRYLLFLGKRIRHCGYFPSWNLRLFKRGKARYEDRPVHEHMIVDGPQGFLKHLLEHNDRRGLEHYIAKHNRYSTLEAETLYFAHSLPDRNLIKPDAFGSSVERRRFFKTHIYPRLPAKWLGRFLWMYFLKLGFLDGMTGLRFCLLISSHELITSLKLYELKQRAKETAHPNIDTLKTNHQQLIEPPVSPSSPSPLTDEFSSLDLRLSNEIQNQKSKIETPPSRHQSPWSTMEKIKRVIWMITRATLFRHSFHNWYGWRRFLLRGFGAKVGKGVRIRPSATIEIPWNLSIDDGAIIGDHAILYSLGKITIGRHCVISQYAHLCAGTHDHSQRSFPLLRPPIVLEEDVWIAADAFVGPGVTIGARSLLGARGSVFKDLPPGIIATGNPPPPNKPRLLEGAPDQIPDA
ncbi:MAG: colanic acid biosynthesis acetyltransferase WcaF [Phycisphaerales bacterium]|nr:colanic acid biosynthesis acetyltransferase WcaF [Phycisphaerales bacterium]